jgi:hypothetical protein
MNLRSFWSFFWRWLVLILAFVVISVICYSVLPQPAIVTSMEKTAETGRALGNLFFLNALYVLVLLYLAIKATQGGWKLYLALLVFHFGCSSFMLHIETLAFHGAFPQLSIPDILLLLLNGFVVSVFINLLIVLVSGKWKFSGSMQIPNYTGIVWSALIYPVIYLLFGFFVAYGSEATRAFYASTSLGGSSDITNQVVLIVLQILRGALWAVCCLPVAAILSRKDELVAVLSIGLPVFSAMGLIHFSPIMPEAVRYAHGFELAISMNIFGVILAFLLSKKTQIMEK